MLKTNRKIELLAPAGNFEKLEIAIHYGADAVYIGGKDFSLRNYSGNFSLDEIQSATDYAHRFGVKVYVACNIYSRNYDQKKIEAYFHNLAQVKPDGIIIADPGIFILASKIMPDIPIHLSTQSNTTNYNTVLFWEDLGVKRINVARELSLAEIKEIALHSNLELEAFVHGAMCISYSGRCLLSSFMANRESNRGMCCHPCRWEYAVVEAQRPGKYFPITQDDHGSYIFNSQDLCMIEHIPEMIESGISALKIEGRIKGINYTASTVKVYREAIDAYYKNPADYKMKSHWIEELSQISHRGYCTGFYFGYSNEISPNYTKSIFSPSHILIGKVVEKTGSHSVMLDVRNKFYQGDSIQVLTQTGPVREDKIEDIFDEDGQHLSVAQPGSRTRVILDCGYSPNDLIRKIDNG
ncbi:MAG: U32 family peptidase [Desulfobacterales bacterium]|nr:U32 family peptidase [Desulfobacterales bacterium]